MQIENLPLFPTPVTVVNDFLSNEQCHDIMKFIDTGKVPARPYGAITQDSVTSFFTLQYFLTTVIEQIPSCYNLTNSLDAIVQQYTQSTGYNVGRLSNSWYSIQTKGSKLRSHTHPYSSLSGVIYVNVDENSSPLVFENPNKQMLAYLYFNKSTNFTAEQYFITPKSGQLILFPSWLIHSSSDIVNQTEKRTIISFNYS